MKRSLLVALSFLSATLSASAAYARPYDDHHDPRRAYYRDRYDDRHDRGYHYGWRGRHYNYRPNHWQYVTVYNEPEYISSYSEVRCVNRSNPFGMLLGAGAGGLAGSTIGKGSGRTAAIVGGAVLGGIVGNNLTQQDCSRQVFRDVPLGQPVSWQAGPQEAYAVVPVRDYREDGRYCREYQSYATVGGKRSQTYGTACMQPDGSWEIIN